MGIFKAIAKGFARTVNDVATNYRKDNAQQKAYKATGKQIAKAKQTGTYVNCSTLYKKNLAKSTRSIEQSHRNIEKLIDDL